MGMSVAEQWPFARHGAVQAYLQIPTSVTGMEAIAIWGAILALDYGEKGVG